MLKNVKKIGCVVFVGSDSSPSAAECSFFKITPTKHIVCETKKCSKSMFGESKKKHKNKSAQRLPSPTLEKTICRTEFLSHVFLTRWQCHTAAAEGAKLSTIALATGRPHLRGLAAEALPRIQQGPAGQSPQN